MHHKANNYIYYSMNYIIEYMREDDNNNKFDESYITIINKSGAYNEYSDISDFIYNLKDDEYKLLRKFFDENYAGEKESIKLTAEDVDKLHHFERHVKLCFAQRDYIAEVAKNATIDATEASKDTVEKFENINMKVSKIYSEFVGILGVFTALSFALMGSVQVFGNLLNNVENPSIKNIGYILVVAGIYLLLIYLVIMTLFIGMKKVFGQDKKYTFSLSFVLIFLCVCVGLISSGLFCVTFG